MKRIKKEPREHIARLEGLGWVLDGRNGNDHFDLTHPSGARTTVAQTPSDHRSRRNELARAKRRVRAAERQDR